MTVDLPHPDDPNKAIVTPFLFFFAGSCIVLRASSIMSKRSWGLLQFAFTGRSSGQSSESEQEESVREEQSEEEEEDVSRI